MHLEIQGFNLLLSKNNEHAMLWVQLMEKKGELYFYYLEHHHNTDTIYRSQCISDLDPSDLNRYMLQEANRVIKDMPNGGTMAIVDKDKAHLLEEYREAHGEETVVNI